MLQCLWPLNFAEWWLIIRGYHLTHYTTWSFDQVILWGPVTTQNTYLHLQKTDGGNQSLRLHKLTFVISLTDKIISPLQKDLWVLNLIRRWFQGGSSELTCSHLKWAIMLDVMFRIKELDKIYRGVLRTLSNIWYKCSCKNSKLLKVLKISSKKVHHR